VSIKAKKVQAFIQHCEKAGIGPSGLIQKVLDVETSIKYLLHRAEDTEEEAAVNTKARATMSKLSLWRKSFRGEKNMREGGLRPGIRPAWPRRNKAILGE